MHEPRSVGGDTAIAIPEIDVTMGTTMDTAYPDIVHHFPNGTTLRPNVRYSTPHHFRPLTMDIYTPGDDVPRPHDGFPAIMFIHGGGWARGDGKASRPMKNFPGLLAAIASRGYVVTSIDYRLVGEAIWPAQGQDVKAAVRFLRKESTRLSIASERIACWGVSCGGHLSAVLATTAGIADLSPDDPNLADIGDHVQAAVSWYGGFDMETIVAQAEASGAFSRNQPNAPEWWLLGGQLHEVDRQFARSAGPVNYASADSAPMLLAVGEKDHIIPPQQSYQMAQALESAGAEVELLVLEGVSHDFASDSYEETLQANRRALERTLAFLDRKLRDVPLT